ncbi:hypothetical protein MNBD_CHLOROFLEXI01-5220 [hydrothermal vent metagenome]|uniref:Uncharacterized protein n=1 Tax=hydrothermal vent metagenome TaxID=652676 RepID=A0A3B0US95_9ZZZZ
MKRIESFLAARLFFLVPQLVGDRIYFISNLNGRNSLYLGDSKDHGWSSLEGFLGGPRNDSLGLLKRA